MAFSLRQIDNKIIILTDFAGTKPAKVITTIPGSEYFYYFEDMTADELRETEKYCASLDPTKRLLKIDLKLI